MKMRAQGRPRGRNSFGELAEANLEAVQAKSAFASSFLRISILAGGIKRVVAGVGTSI
jgi:hypothetical protein